MGVESDRDCHDLPLPSLGCCVGSMSNGQEFIGKAYPRGRPEPSYRRGLPTSPRFAQSLEQDTIPESYKPPPRASWLPSPVQPAGSAKSTHFSFLRPQLCPDNPIEDTEGSPRPALANDQASRRTLPLGCASPAAGVSKLLVDRRTQRIWTPKWAKTPIRPAILGGDNGLPWDSMMACGVQAKLGVLEHVCPLPRSQRWRRRTTMAEAVYNILSLAHPRHVPMPGFLDSATTPRQYF